MDNLYSNLKIFHYQEKLDSLPADVGIIKAPIHIRIKPTNACNHDCWYCAYRVDNLQLGKDMLQRDYIPRDKMLEIIEDLVEMDVKAVTFSGGGEPLLYKHIGETLRKLAETNIKFATLTNGARLKGEVAEILAHKGTWVRVSMDGWDDASYAEYRGIKHGEFSLVMNNMEQFKKLGGQCFLSVVIIVDNKNYPHLFDLCKRLKDIGVDSVKIAPCIVSNDMIESNEYHKPIFGAVKAEIARVVDELSGANFSIYDSYHELIEKFANNYSWCPYIQILPVIGADQNVYPCHDKAYNLENGLMGSIKNQRFKDFWFADKSRFFKINPSIHCNHHCVANQRNKLVLEYLSTDNEHQSFV